MTLETTDTDAGAAVIDGAGAAAPYAAPTRLRRARGSAKVYYRSAAVYLLLLAAVFVAAESNALPYYVKDLLSLGGGLVFLGFPLGIFVAFAPPIVFARWCSRGGWGRTALLPVFVLVHSLVVWAGVRGGAPVAAIVDLVGPPAMGWPGELEIMGRFLALFGTVSALFVGGAHLAASVAGPHVERDRGALRRWTAPALVLLGISYVVVVPFAATHNVVELMAGGGTIASCAWLGAWLLNAGLGASSLAAAMRLRTSALIAAAIVVVGVPIGWVALTFGTASTIDKYGEAFSAMQFLFSADRHHYAEGEAPLKRYFFAHLGLVLAAAMVQMPFAGHRNMPTPPSPRASRIPRAR
ncbi:MAG TPA: hypothetical protein VFU59_10635 [Candidatus Eisenbacteria bacterium]|nr:hypothetical protein [Candidatus Eisenbacteria bacterium]